MVDKFSKEVRSKIMSRIRSKNTKPELKLRKALWKQGLRGYKLHAKLTGSPDIVFTKKKVAIFVDGDFWHGYNFKKIWERIKDKPFWRKKIVRNMERDKFNNKQLRRESWVVLRFWEHQVLRNSKACARKVKNTLNRICEK